MEVKDKETKEVVGTKFVYGFAKHMRDALPQASFIGFTGTPIELDDKDTRAVFGDYVSIYDIEDAKNDGATVPSTTKAASPNSTSTARRSTS